MEVAVLHPRDCLNDIFSRKNITPPHRQEKPLTDRRRRSLPRQQDASSPPPSIVPKSSKKKNHSQINNIVSDPVIILKRGEDISIKRQDLSVEKPDLRSTCQIRSDPVKISTQIRSTPALFYAGPVTSTSPPPSEVPLPAFFAKKNVSVLKSTDATNDLIRILRLDIA